MLINTELASFLAYGSGFSGGLTIAAADVNGDSIPDLITGAGPGAGPHVKVFDGADVTNVLASFHAFAPAFAGGVRVAAGDMTNDGRAEIIVGSGPGAGAGPHVRVFSGATFQQLSGARGSFYAYATSYTGGIFVAAGDVNADGRADIITGPGANHAARVKVFSGVNASVLQSYLVFDASYTSGVRVGSDDLDDDGKFDVLAGAGPGTAMRMQARSGATTQLLTGPLGDSYPFGYSGTSGLFVSAGVPIPPFTTASLKGTVMALSSSPNPAVSGQPFTLSAYVSASNPADGTPSGTVTFTEDGAPLGSGTLSEVSPGVAAASVPVTLYGPYWALLSAHYPNGSYWASSSAVLSLQVVGDVTQTPPTPVPPLPPQCPLPDQASGNSPGLFPPGMTPLGFSARPVRYADGVAALAFTDLESDGYGVPWGHTRNWTNGSGYVPYNLNGTGTTVTQLPALRQTVAGSNSTGPVGNVVSGASRASVARQGLLFGGIRPSKRMAKWFKACFQPTIGIVHFFDASLIAR